METMEWVACVGIDWAEKEHTYAGRDRSGALFEGRFGSSAEHVHDWVRQLRERIATGVIVIAIEQGRGSLLYALAMYDFLALVPINPRASKSYRDSLRLSGASSDPADAMLICDFALKHLAELRLWRPDDALKQYFPQALEWLGGESSVCLRALIERWPTLQAMRKATAAQLTAMLRSQRRQKAVAVGQELFAHVRSATPLITDAAIIEPMAMYARSVIAMLIPLEHQIAVFEQAIAEMWSDHPDRAIFGSLPGAGPVLAPRLAVAFGRDRDRYDTARELQCYSGIAPVIEASGKQRWVHKRYGYPKFLHQTFHEFAQCSIPQSRWARAFYQEQRSRGAGHHEAIRSLAFRWIRIMITMWKNNTSYDEQHYIDTLVARRSPLAVRLVA